MARAAIYCRVSSDEQAERGTIESQVHYAKKYIDLHGPEANITEYEFYLDEGVSGTIPLVDRPAGAKLIADARGGKYQALYVYRLDRLARSVKHVLDTYDILESQGIALKSMTEAFDTGTPTGKFFMTLLASIAALERDTILERTLMGKERNARQGKWVSGAPPFGYRIGTDGRLRIYEPEAETVRLIFKLYQDGLSTIDVAKYLSARDIPTPAKSKGSNNLSTGKWHAGHISIILRTKTYTGEYTYLKRSKRKKETISIEVPAIIERNSFADTQERLIENADAARGSRGRHYLLRGLIYCGNCGRAMVGNSGNSKQGRVYYRCTNTINYGDGKKCNAKMVRAQAIEQAVWGDVQKFIRNPGKIGEIMDARVVKNKQDLSPIKKELAEVEQAIFDKQAARGKVLSLCTRGIISEQEAESELHALSIEIQTLESRRDFLFEKQDKAQQMEVETLNAKVIFESIKEKLPDLSEDEKAEAIRCIVRRIDLYTIEAENGKRGTRAEIQYKFHCPEEGSQGLGLSESRDA